MKLSSSFYRTSPCARVFVSLTLLRGRRQNAKCILINYVLEESHCDMINVVKAPFVFEQFRLKLSTSCVCVWQEQWKNKKAQKFDCENDNLQLRGLQEKTRGWNFCNNFNLKDYLPVCACGGELKSKIFMGNSLNISTDWKWFIDVEEERAHMGWS